MFKFLFYCYIACHCMYFCFGDEDSERNVIDKPILVLKMKDSDVTKTIYLSDLYRYALIFQSSPDAKLLDNIFRLYIMNLFSTPLPAENYNKITSLVLKQVKEQSNSMLESMNFDHDLFERFLTLSQAEYEEIVFDFQMLNQISMAYMQANIGELSVDVDEVEDYYNKNFVEGNAKIAEVPDKYDVWSIIVKAYNLDKAQDYVKRIGSDVNKFDEIYKNNSDEEIETNTLISEYHKDGDLDKNMRKYIFNLKVNAVSGLYHDKKGLYIFRKVQEKGQNFTCKYLYFPNYKFKKNKELANEFLNSLKEYLKDKGEQAQDAILEKLTIEFNNKRIFKGIECKTNKMYNKVLSEIKNKNDAEKIKSLQDRGMTDVITVGGEKDPVYKILILIKKHEKHIPDLEHDFYIFKNKVLEAKKEDKIRKHIAMLLEALDLEIDDEIPICKAWKETFLSLYV